MPMAVKNISAGQWPHFRHWLILIALAETGMLVFNRSLVTAYCLITALFFAGFLLRSLRFYPGQWKPLSLDAGAAAIALCYAVLARLTGLSPWRFLLILSSSLILFPHFIYIFKEK